jgi:RNA polymerase sigma-70 factor (ECF subfamily)
MRGIDEEKLIRVLKEHGPCLRRFLLSRGASADDVDDLIQDTFVVAWRKREVILDGKARQYLTGMAQCILMAHRRKNRTRERLINTHRDKILREVFPGASDGTSETGDADAQHNSRLRECLDELPAISREVLELVYLRGMTRKEAAETIGCSVNALYFRERRAFSQLRSGDFFKKIEKSLSHLE